MRILLSVFILFCLVMISCTKNTSTPQSPHEGLLRIITDTLPGSPGWLEERHFAYDETDRLTVFSDSVYHAAVYQSVNTFTFNYDGDNKFPAGYTLLRNNNSGPANTETHIILYNTQGKIAEDSLLPGTDNTGNIYFQYIDGIAIRTVGYYPASSQKLYVETVDSSFFDQSGNVVDALFYVNTTPPPVYSPRLADRQKSTIGTVENPFYNTPAGILFTLRIGFPGKYCPQVTDEYNSGSNTVTTSHQLQNDVYPDGSLKRIRDLGTGGVSLLDYY